MTEIGSAVGRTTSSADERTAVRVSPRAATILAESFTKEILPHFHPIPPYTPFGVVVPFVLYIKFRRLGGVGKDDKWQVFKKVAHCHINKSVV